MSLISRWLYFLNEKISVMFTIYAGFPLAVSRIRNVGSITDTKIRSFFPLNKILVKR